MKKGFPIIFLLYFQLCFAQNDSNQYLNIQKKLQSYDKIDCISIGSLFIGKPYKKNILNKCYPNEKLNTSLNEFDCVTFVETVLALNEDFHSSKPSFENFKNNLKYWRYRNGIIDCQNRLHYFSDWIQYHEIQKDIKNVTKDLGGILVEKNFNFMSSNRKKYNFLVDDLNYNAVYQTENYLRNLPFYSIPKEKINEIESKVQNGDIIGITSSKKSIDIDHIGFAIVINNELYLMHASYHFKRVVSKVETLKKYINRHKHHSGIVVLRVLK